MRSDCSDEEIDMLRSLNDVPRWKTQRLSAGQCAGAEGRPPGVWSEARCQPSTCRASRLGAAGRIRAAESAPTRRHGPAGGTPHPTMSLPSASHAWNVMKEGLPGAD